MKRSDIIYQIEQRTDVPRNIIAKVLKAMSVVIAAELQANEPVEAPHLGILYPGVEKPARGNKRERVILFEASKDLRKKLATPIRRLRVVSAD